MRALLGLSFLLAAPRVAAAGGTSLDLISPRSVGRAGAAVVSDDSAAAVVLNPAGLARRDGRRAQLALVVVDDAARYDAPGSGPEVDERGPTQVYPVVGGAGRLGPIVVGVALLREASFSRRFAAPPIGLEVDDVERLYPHRHAGLDARHRRTTLGLGAAWRAAEWLAIGASLTASRVELDETRRIWAGFGLRDMPVGNASRDLGIRLDGRDGFVPGFAAGLLIAPIDAPVEIAASVAWSDRARMSGGVTTEDPMTGAGPSINGSGSSRVELASPLVIRTGARWLGERWIVELGAELWTYPRRGAEGTWTIEGVTVTDDITPVSAEVDALRSQVVRRRHGAVRGALDLEVVPGLLWVTGGWAWQSAATPEDRLSPAAGDLGGHTAALGAEIATDGFTVTLGLAHTFVRQATIEQTRLRLDNPFDAGTAPTGLGHVDQGRDTIAVTVEVELPE